MEQEAQTEGGLRRHCTQGRSAEGETEMDGGTNGRCKITAGRAREDAVFEF